LLTTNDDLCLTIISNVSIDLVINMPRVLGYTPSWLSRPSPGSDLFTPKTKARDATNGSRNTTQHEGSRRTIAVRGTEIFLAVGNELRWADLVLLKEQAEKQGRPIGRSFYGNSQATGSIEELGDSYKVYLRAMAGYVEVC